MIEAGVQFKVAPGKVSSHAVKWAEKLLAYHKKAGLGGAWSLLRPMTGGMHEILFTARFPSMAEYEEDFRKQREDSGFMAIVKEMTESDWNLDNRRKIYEVVVE